MTPDRPIPLPKYRYIKSRAVSDYTFSDHAQGWDDCLNHIRNLMIEYDVPFDEPTDITSQDCYREGLE